MLLLLEHYRTGLVLSKKLDASLAYLQLQLGTNVCPFDLDYDNWGYFAPLSWTKMLWRTLSVSGFSLHLEYEMMASPRVGDKVVADMFQEYSADKDILTSLQRVRGSMNVIFLSDMVTADGKFIESEMVDKRGLCGIQSKYDFPLECPTEEDEMAWIEFWSDHCQDNYSLPTPLGRWINASHREWEWYHEKI